MTRRLLPEQPAPRLDVALVGGGRFLLSEAKIEAFFLIDFYRGRHCPRCHRHLLDLNSKIAHLRRRNVEAIAVSMDPQDRAEEARSVWGLNELDVGYGLDLEAAEAWDLFLSRSINEREKTEVFAEPATFLIAPDHTVYSAVYNSTPFNRFSFSEMLEAIDTIMARSYPPRGGWKPGGG